MKMKNGKVSKFVPPPAAPVATSQFKFSDLKSAFESWEIQYRSNPRGYMNCVEILAANTNDLAEMRALYLLKLLGIK